MILLISTFIILTLFSFLIMEKNKNLKKEKEIKKILATNSDLFDLCKKLESLLKISRSEGIIYYRAVYESISYLTNDQYELILNILKESETFRKVFNLKHNKVDQIDKDLFHSSIESLKNIN